MITYTKQAQAKAGKAIDALTRQYMVDHPSTGYEKAFYAVIDSHPELVARYSLPEAVLKPSEPTPEVREELGDAAGERILDLARIYQQSHPGVSAEDAIREVIRTDQTVAGIYLHAHDPLLVVEEL